jgi:hypothetical protein
MNKEEIRKLAEEIVKQVNIEPSDLDAIEATEEILIGSIDLTEYLKQR